jgi:hypothetical protein
MTELDLFALPVHPAAALLPMLSAEELDELAGDIRTNGQRQPIVVLVESNGRRAVLDGRNRLEACRRARVTPLHVSVTSADVPHPALYVLGANVHRRHLSKSSRAMAIAMLSPVGKPGRAATDKTPSNLGISTELVRQARRVLEQRPAIAQQILAGNQPLEPVYRSLAGLGGPSAARARVGSSTSEPPARKPAPPPATSRASSSRSPPPTRPTPPAQRAAPSPTSAPIAPTAPSPPASVPQSRTQSDFERVLAALAVLGNVRTDAARLTGEHGPAATWPNFERARAFMRALEGDSSE